MRQGGLLLYGRGIMMNQHSTFSKVGARYIETDYLCCLNPTVPFGSSAVDY